MPGWAGPIPAGMPAKARPVPKPSSSSAGQWTGTPPPVPAKIAQVRSVLAPSPKAKAEAQVAAPMPPKLPAAFPPLPPPGTLPTKEEEPQEEAVPVPGMAAAAGQALPAVSAAAAGIQAAARAVQPAAAAGSQAAARAVQPAAAASSGASGRGNKMPPRPLAEQEAELWADLDELRASMSALAADIQADKDSAADVLHACLLPHNCLQGMLRHCSVP